MSWFSDHGVKLKTEDDGSVFPVSNNSSSVIDCLVSEAKKMEGRIIERKRKKTKTQKIERGRERLNFRKRGEYCVLERGRGEGKRREKMAMRELISGGAACAVPGSTSSSNPVGTLANALIGSSSKTQVS